MKNLFKTFKNFNQKVSKKVGYLEKIKKSRNLQEDLTSAIEYENFVFDLDEDFDGIPCFSSLSKMMQSIDVPEVKEVNSSFVYNFFEKTERLIDNPDRRDVIIDLREKVGSKNLFEIQAEKVPRYIKISFKSAKSVFSKFATFKEKQLLKNLSEDDIEFESAGSAASHTGIEFKDTGAEKSVYRFLKKVSDHNGTSRRRDSQLSAAKKLARSLKTEEDDDDSSADFKRVLLDFFNSSRTDQVVFAKNDVTSPDDKYSDDSVANQNFFTKTSNEYINSMFRRANRYPTGVFQDEIFSALQETENMQQQQQNVKKVSNSVDELDYVRTATKFAIESDERSNSRLIRRKKPEIKLLGYYVEKTEIFNDDAIKTYDPIILEDTNNLFFIDPNVRYGGRYVYKIRTLCLIRSPMIKLDPDNPILDEVVVGRFIAASEGVTTTTSCFETIPPPPPSAIRSRFDFKRKMPVITWQFPVNPQRDIKRFQIFKRLNVTDPFTLVAEYNFDDSVDPTSVNELAQTKNMYIMRRPKLTYTDVNFDTSSQPIYALASVDAHGMTSNLSAQIGVKYEKYKNKLIKRLVSKEGAPKQYPNIYLEEDTFKDVIKVSNYDNMHVFFDPDAYKVFSFNKADNKGKRKDNDRKDRQEYDLGFLAVNPDSPTYTIQILNVDQQKDSLVDIKIEDVSGSPIRLPASLISKINTSNKK